MSEMKSKLLDYIFLLVYSMKKFVLKFQVRLTWKQLRELDLKLFLTVKRCREWRLDQILFVVLHSTCHEILLQVS